MPEDSENNRTDFALLRQEVRYMGSEVKKLGTEFHDFRTSYITREQALVIRHDLEEQIIALRTRLNGIYRYGSIILGLVTTALIGAVLRLIIKS